MRRAADLAAQLQRLGIEVLHDLPGVGQNLHDHPDVVLAGTGEGNIFGSRAGVGILRSTDAGKTWALMPGSGIFARMSVAKVAFDPDDPTSRRIFVALFFVAF